MNQSFQGLESLFLILVVQQGCILLVRRQNKTTILEYGCSHKYSVKGDRF
jgi:hypothetical protein